MDYFCGLQLQETNYIHKFNYIGAALTEHCWRTGLFPQLTSLPGKAFH